MISYYLFTRPDIAFGCFEDRKIGQTIRDKMKPGKALYRELCCLYNSVTSTSSSDPQQYADYIRDLAQLPVYSSQVFDADICTSAFQNIADELMWMFDRLWTCR